MKKNAASKESVKARTQLKMSTAANFGNVQPLRTYAINLLIHEPVTFLCKTQRGDFRYLLSLILSFLSPHPLQFESKLLSFLFNLVHIKKT